MKRPDPGVTIRMGGPEDCQTIHDGLMLIAQALEMPHRITSTAEQLHRYGFGPAPMFKVLIAEAEGEFAGMCLFFPSFSTWRGEAGAYIQDFVVAPAFRGSALASDLLSATARHAANDWGARYLRLSVDQDNARARRFYESMGLSWSRSEAIHAAYGDAFEALTEKDIKIRGIAP